MSADTLKETRKELTSDEIAQLVYLLSQLPKTTTPPKSRLYEPDKNHSVTGGNVSTVPNVPSKETDECGRPIIRRDNWKRLIAIPK